MFMGFFNRFCMFRFMSGVAGGISTVSDRFKKRCRIAASAVRGLSFKKVVKKPNFFKFHHNQRRLLSVALFLTAILLAIKAHDISQGDGIQKWLRDHPPSLKILEFSLGSRGLRSLAFSQKNEKIFQKVIRTLPTSLDEEGAIWLSQDETWVASYYGKDHEIQPYLFCAECSTLPKNWRSLGFGWPAFESLISAIDQRLTREQKKSPLEKKKVWRDPREISY